MPERGQPELSETFIVLRAQAGDIDAFDALYRLYAPVLLRHLHHVIGDADRAEDALQDVFLLVHRKVRWLRDPASVRPWLYRLATRHALRMLRTRHRRRESQLSDEEWAQIARHATVAPFDRALTSEEVRRAISQLPAISRAVLSLHYLEALPLADVARLRRRIARSPSVPTGLQRQKALVNRRLRASGEPADDDVRAGDQWVSEATAAGGLGLPLTTEALICDIPEEKKEAPGGGGGMPGGGMGGMY